MCTQVYLMESTCDTDPRDTLVRFVVYGGGGCTLTSFYPLMSMASMRTGEDGGLEEILGVSFGTSKCVMYGMVYNKPAHIGDRYRDVPFDQMCFGDLGQTAVHDNVSRPRTILNVSGDHIIPQNPPQARNLPDSDRWPAVEEEEMASIQHNKVVTRTFSYRSDGVIAIAIMFTYALKWNLMSTIEQYKARWVVLGVVEIPDVYSNPDVTRDHVDSDSSLLVMTLLVVRFDSPAAGAHHATSWCYLS